MEDGGIPKGATSASLLKEAIHVISCGYEDKTEWGKEVCMEHLLVLSAGVYDISCVCVTVLNYTLSFRLDGYMVLLQKIY